MTAATSPTTEKLYDLEIELQADGSVNLSQDCGSGNTEYCSLHRSQVQRIAELVGLIRPLAAADEQAPSTAELERTVTRLQRTLLAVRDRTEQLFKALCVISDLGHEDLSLEVAKCAALSDIIDLAVGDFEDDYEMAEKKIYGRPSAADVPATSLGTAAGQPLDNGAPSVGNPLTKQARRNGKTIAQPSVRHSSPTPEEQPGLAL